MPNTAPAPIRTTHYISEFIGTLVILLIATAELLGGLFLSFAQFYEENVSTSQLGFFQICYTTPYTNGCVDISWDDCEYTITGKIFSVNDCDFFNGFRVTFLIALVSVGLATIADAMLVIALISSRYSRILQVNVIFFTTLGLISLILSLGFLGVTMSDAPSEFTVREDSSLIFAIVSTVFIFYVLVRHVYAFIRTSGSEEDRQPLLG